MVISTLVISLLAIAAMAGGVGFIVGAGQTRADTQFTPAEQDFMHGLVRGTEIRSDPAYKTDPARRSVCAGQFYPDHPDAMAGCVQALHNPGPGGYRMPH